jgi:hypothetical protein
MFNIWQNYLMFFDFMDVIPKSEGKGRKEEQGQIVSAFIKFHKFVTFLYTLFC